MIITINTDASFSFKHKIGTFAFWVVCDRFKILKSGILKGKVLRADEAESKCIINAIFMTLREDVSGVRRIIINTDCTNAIAILTGDGKAIARYDLGYGKSLRKKFNALTNDCGIKIEFRHVKAHTGVGDARSYVNEWCDKQAKQMMCSQIGPYIAKQA